jgi:malonyl-CoA O-methyltransferase
MQRWHQALQVDGFLMFSCLGPDTLMEMRALYQALGWPQPTHAFTDMHDWGDMLLAAGFAEPVMDHGAHHSDF